MTEARDEERSDAASLCSGKGHDLSRQGGAFLAWCWLGMFVSTACRDYTLPSVGERAGQPGYSNVSGQGGNGEVEDDAGGSAGDGPRTAGAGGAPADLSESGAPGFGGTAEEGSAGGRAVPDSDGGDGGARAADAGGGNANHAGAGEGSSGAAMGGAASEEPITLSTCIYQYTPISINAGPAADVTASLTNGAIPYTLFTSRPSTEIVAVTWKASAAVEDDWVPLHCFDRVPSPRRVAASNLVNNMIEVYATTGEGELYTRQTTIHGYEPWARLSVPSKTHVLDVAVVDPVGERPALYVATGEDGVYVRTRTSDEPYAAYGAWRSVTPTSASVIAVGVLPDGRHNLVVMDAENVAHEFIETRAGAEFEFAQPDAWDFRATDATFALDAAGSFKTFAIVEDGALLVREFMNGTWQAWTELKRADAAPHLVTLASGSYPAQPLFLFGVDRDGLAQVSRDAARSWQTLP
jgi:hypothetical protein